MDANVRETNYAGLSPLHVLLLRASSSQIEDNIAARTKTISMLVAAGADVNHALPKESAPLYLLVRARQWDLAETLIKAGADVNVKNKQGLTPLAYLLQILLEGGIVPYDLRAFLFVSCCDILLL